MKLAFISVLAMVVTMSYQLSRYSLGYHKHVLAHEMNTEALLAMELQLALLNDEYLAERNKNIDMANKLDAARGMFMVGCMDAGKSEMFCLKKKSKYGKGIW